MSSRRYVVYIGTKEWIRNQRYNIKISKVPLTSYAIRFFAKESYINPIYAKGNVFEGRKAKI